MRKILFLFIISLSIFVGCSQEPARPAQNNQTDSQTVEAVDELPQNIDIGTVEQIRHNDDVILIDVREDYEYDAGHIPDAKLISLGQISSRMDEIPKDKTVVMVCRSGNRSNQATEFLRSEGFDNVHNMLGGMNEWAQAGYEIEE